MIPRFFNVPSNVKLKTVHVFRDVEEVRLLLNVTARNMDRMGVVLPAHADACDFILRVRIPPTMELYRD